MHKKDIEENAFKKYKEYGGVFVECLCSTYFKCTRRMFFLLKNDKQFVFQGLYEACNAYKIIKYNMLNRNFNRKLMSGNFPTKLEIL